MKNISFLALLIALFCTSSVFGQDAHARNKANIYKAYDALNKRDWATFASLCTPDYTELSVGPGPVKGIDAAIEVYKQFAAAFPDFMVKIQEIAPVSTNRYLLHVTITGTNTGAFMMLPPTGKHIQFEDADAVDLNADGKCTTHSATNPNEAFRQIGYGSILNPSTGVVIGIYEKFGKGDVPGILEGSSNDVVFDIQDRMFDAQARMFKGKAEVGQFFQELGSKFQYSKFQPVRFIADGDDVIVLIDAEYKYVPTGKVYASTYTHHFKVMDGKVTYFRGLDDFQMMK